MELSLKDLERIVGIGSDTLRTYLGRFTFTKYMKQQKVNNYRQTVFSLEQNFVDDFKEFLISKRHRSNADRLVRYWREHKYD